MKMERRKVKGYISRYTLLRSTSKNGEGGWPLTHKLYLLHLDETEEIFYKETMRDLLTKKNECTGEFGVEIIFGSNFNN